MENNNEHSERSYQTNYFGILELSDAVLRTNDGHMFKIHQCILAKGSSYFYALFCGIGKGRQDILISDIPGKVLGNVLSYLYTNKCHLTDKNICELLIAADYLIVDGLVLHIKTHLKENLSANNSLELFMIATQINQVDILRGTFRFIQTRFEAVMLNEDSDLMKLPIETLKQFLGDKNLCVTGEKTVWLVIAQWITADVENRQCWVLDLLTYLILCDVDEQLAAEILEHNIVTENPFCKKIKELKLSSFTSNLEILKNYIQSLPHPFLPVYSRRLPTTLYFIAHYCVFNQIDGIHIYVTYDDNMDLWRKVHDFSLCPEFLIYINDNIYMLGTSENKIFRYNLVEKKLDELNSFNLERYGVVDLQDCIYVLGGICARTGREKYDVNVFDTNESSWYKAMPMLPVISFSVEPLGGHIYVLGNTPRFFRFEMIMQVYNPGTDYWSMLAPPSIFRYNFAFTAYHGKLFLIGGSNNEEYLKSVEVYNPAEQQWTDEVSLPYVFYLPKAIVLNDQMIVYDNHLEDRNYLKTDPPVVWNDEQNCWESVDESSPWVHLHKYCIFTPNSSGCLEKIAKQNKNHSEDFTKSPFN